MNDQKFDELTRRLAASTSRRSVVKAVGAGIAGLFLSAVGRERATADTRVPGTGGNGACDTFCDATFVGQAQGDCTSQAAHHTGPCFVCGPSAPAGHPQACGVGTTSAACCPATTPTCCGNTTCVNLQTDVHNCGACGHVCSNGNVCVAGVCVCSAGTSACAASAYPACGTPRPGGTCGCTGSVEGTCSCGENFTCGSTSACTTSAQCVTAHGAGWFCQDSHGGVCGAGVCVPACGTTGFLGPIVPPGPGTNAGG